MEIEWRLIKSSAYRSRLRFLRERRIDFVDIIIILMMTCVGISHKTLHSLYNHNVILTLRPAPGTTDGPLRPGPPPLRPAHPSALGWAGLLLPRLDETHSKASLKP